MTTLGHNRTNIAAELANLESQRLGLNAQIERLRQMAKYESQLNYQGN